jgi:hypothetical protein
LAWTLNYRLAPAEVALLWVLAYAEGWMGGDGDLTRQLRDLAAQHRDGMISDQEYAAEKRRLLGGVEQMPRRRPSPYPQPPLKTRNGCHHANRTGVWSRW